MSGMSITSTSTLRTDATFKTFLGGKNDLPLEIWQIIFSYLSVRDLCCVARVSKSWNDLALSIDPTRWKELYLACKEWRHPYWPLSVHTEPLSWKQAYRNQHQWSSFWNQCAEQVHTSGCMNLLKRTKERQTIEVGPGLQHQTLRSALAVASEYDRVLVHPGIYDEQVELWVHTPVDLVGVGELGSAIVVACLGHMALTGRISNLVLRAPWFTNCILKKNCGFLQMDNCIVEDGMLCVSHPAACHVQFCTFRHSTIFLQHINISIIRNCEFSQSDNANIVMEGYPKEEKCWAHHHLCLQIDAIFTQKHLSGANRHGLKATDSTTSTLHSVFTGKSFTASTIQTSETRSRGRAGSQSTDFKVANGVCIVGGGVGLRCISNHEGGSVTDALSSSVPLMESGAVSKCRTNEAFPKKIIDSNGVATRKYSSDDKLGQQFSGAHPDAPMTTFSRAFGKKADFVAETCLDIKTKSVGFSACSSIETPALSDFSTSAVHTLGARRDHSQQTNRVIGQDGLAATSSDKSSGACSICHNGVAGHQLSHHGEVNEVGAEHWLEISDERKEWQMETKGKHRSQAGEVRDKLQSLDAWSSQADFGVRMSQGLTVSQAKSEDRRLLSGNDLLVSKKASDNKVESDDSHVVINSPWNSLSKSSEALRQLSVDGSLISNSTEASLYAVSGEVHDLDTVIKIRLSMNQPAVDEQSGAQKFPTKPAFGPEHATGDLRDWTRGDSDKQSQREDRNKADAVFSRDVFPQNLPPLSSISAAAGEAAAAHPSSASGFPESAHHHPHHHHYHHPLSSHHPEHPTASSSFTHQQPELVGNDHLYIHQLPPASTQNPRPPPRRENAADILNHPLPQQHLVIPQRPSSGHRQPERLEGEGRRSQGSQHSNGSDDSSSDDDLSLMGDLESVGSASGAGSHGRSSSSSSNDSQLEGFLRAEFDYDCSDAEESVIMLPHLRQKHLDASLSANAVNADLGSICSQTSRPVTVSAQQDESVMSHVHRVRGCLVHLCRMNHSKGGVMVSLQAHAIVSACDISNVTYAIRCIQNSRVVIVKNRLHHCLTSGIFMRLAASGLISGNDIHSNNEAGLDIRKNADPIVQHNRIHHGKRSGIVVLGSGRGLIRSNNIYSNNEAGIYVLYGGNPSISENNIYDGKAAGVAVNEGGRGFIFDNTISSNQWGGVDIRRGSCPMVCRNTITNGLGDGIVVGDQGRGIIENNIIADNAGCGLWLMNARVPFIHGNQISNNGDAGVMMVNKTDIQHDESHLLPAESLDHISHSLSMMEESEDDPLVLRPKCVHTTLQHNNIYHNAGHGVALELGDTVDILYNAIYANQRDGVWVQQDASVSLLDNSISCNNGHGVNCGQESQMKIKGNGIYDNGESGVMCGGDIEITDNDVVGNLAGGITVDYPGSVKIKYNRVQSSASPFIRITAMVSQETVVEGNKLFVATSGGEIEDLSGKAVITSNKISLLGVAREITASSAPVTRLKPGRETSFCKSHYLTDPPPRPAIPPPPAPSELPAHNISAVAKVMVPSGDTCQQGSKLCCVL